MSETVEIELNAFPPAGPEPVEGCVHVDGNQDPQDYQWTPSIDNNAVSGVVIDQNETKVENRGPDNLPPPTVPEVFDGDPQDDPDTIGHPASRYQDPDLDFYDPPHMIAPDTLPPVVPTRPPDWVDETFADPAVKA